MAYKYAKECKYIWNNLIPKSGQADNLQGELLRQIEKLAWEAQDNGNINWDSDFEYFCDFLNSNLCNSDAISKEEQKQVLQKIKAAGQGLEPIHVEDDLFDSIRNAIGAFYAKNKELILYETNPNINR
ncbi:MAG: hypothetical protein ACK5HL_02850 [Bacilli bacterium]